MCAVSVLQTRQTEVFVKGQVTHDVGRRGHAEPIDVDVVVVVVDVADAFVTGNCSHCAEDASQRMYRRLIMLYSRN